MNDTPLNDSGASPTVPATRRARGCGARVLVLAALAVVAGIAWYVPGTSYAPGASTDRRQDPAEVEVLVFHAAWCGPCAQMAPEVEGLRRRFPALAVSRIDIDAQPDRAAALGIESVPTVLVVHDGAQILLLSGFHTCDELSTQLGRVVDLEKAASAACPHDH